MLKKITSKRWAIKLLIMTMIVISSSVDVFGWSVNFDIEGQGSVTLDGETFWEDQTFLFFEQQATSTVICTPAKGWKFFKATYTNANLQNPKVKTTPQHNCSFAVENISNAHFLFIDPTDWLHFVSLKDGGTVRLDKSGLNASSLTATFQYSKDRKTWNDYTWPDDAGKGGAAITLTNAGDTVWFRAKGIEGKNATLSTSKQSFFSFAFGNNDSIAAGGNIMSLYNDSCLQDTMTTYGFHSLFEGATQLVTAPRLPATKLADSCYQTMFCYCTALTKAPELKATTLAKNCYYSMFYNCTSLEVDTCQNDAECEGALLVVPEPEPAPADWNKYMFKNCKGAYASNIQLGGHYCIKEYLPIQIGEKNYKTLAEAIAASQDGDTIRLKDNTTIAAKESAIIPGGVVLDNNNKTLTNNGKFGWDISENKVSMLDFKKFNDFGELDIVTSLDNIQDTVYKLAINTGSMEGKKFVLRGIEDKIDMLKIIGQWSQPVAYGHKIYQLHNLTAPAAKSEINAGFIIPSDTLYLYVYEYPRIEVMTDSFVTLKSKDYVAAPYDWHGGAVYVYQRGKLFSSSMNYINNSAALGGAIYNTGRLVMGFNKFEGNTARMGGAIYNFSGTVTISGEITLVTATDTWVNEGYKTGKEIQYAKVIWPLASYSCSDYLGSIKGFEHFSNFGPYTKQIIQVKKDQETGTYKLATGDFSNVEGKDKFYLQFGSEEMPIYINGEAVVFGERAYVLKVINTRLIIVVSAVNAKIDLAVTSMGKATIYSDKNLVVPAGVRVYGMKWDNNQGKLICTNADAYKAGDILPSEMGYLVEGAADTYSFYETDEDANVIALSELSGVTVETATIDVEGTIFTLSNGYNGVGFYTFVGETLKANRAFYNSTNPNTKFYIGMDEAAGVESLSSNSTNENMYNLSGMRVNENYKGVVIMNGKKVVK